MPGVRAKRPTTLAVVGRIRRCVVHVFDTGWMDERDRQRDAAQHWRQPWQEPANALPVPPDNRHHDAQVLVRAYLVWSDDGPQTIQTVTYAWTTHPRAVLVQVDDRRYRFVGAWLPPWDVLPHRGIGTLWTNRWGRELDRAPWDG